MAKITSTSTVVTLPSPSFVLRNVPGAWWASVDARPPGSAPADDADRLPPRCGRPSNVTFLLRTGVGPQPECNLSRASSEEGRVGTGGGSTWRSWLAPDN